MTQNPATGDLPHTAITNELCASLRGRNEEQQKDTSNITSPLLLP